MIFEKKEEQKKVTVKATRLFHRTRDSKKKIVCHRGGTRAGKSYAIQQVLFLDKLFNEKDKKFLILRKTLPSLKLSGLLDFKKFLLDYNLDAVIEENKQTLDYYYRPNNNFIHFGSLDDPSKIRSTSWHYIYLQEATDFTYEDYLESLRRLSEPSKDGKRNQLFMCLNPIDEYHWIKTEVLDKEKDIEEIVSTHLDNPFIDDDYRAYLESLIDKDINHYNIFVLGEWGRLQDIIYNNWCVVKEVPEGEVIYGLDFGFVAPTALVKITVCKKDGKKSIYLEQLLYESGLTNSDLIEKLKKLIPNKRRPIYADVAEPARIKEIYDENFNIFPADKDIQTGIDFVKRFQLNIQENSLELLKEIKSYSRRKDRQGRVLEEPVKFRDHTLDAIRYGIYTHLKSSCENMVLKFI